jgi:hypothetical protein
VLRQRHEAELPWPITAVFVAMLEVLARGRWAGTAALGLPGEAGGAPPAVGRRYSQLRGQVLRRGRVVECLRPVALTLNESLIDPPCRVRLRLRWRLEPLDGKSLVRLDARIELLGAAPLRKRHWNAQIDAYCGRMMERLRKRLEAAGEPQGAGVSGQMTGSSSMEVTNTISVKGTPTFR